MTLTPGQRLGSYEIIALLGSGGMGQVYRARDPRLQRDIAIKVLQTNDPEHRRRFEREALSVAALNHPNIVTIHSVEEADGVPFLTMELVEGRALSSVIPTNGMPLPDLLPIAAVLFVWFFLFDSVVTLLRRAFRGEKVWQAHREHLFQRLVDSGLSHRQVTIFYGVLALILCTIILLSIEFRDDIEIAILPVVMILTSILLIVLAKRGVLA